MAAAAQWFAAHVVGDADKYRVLLFNCARSKEPQKLLRCLLDASRDFDAVLFCTFRSNPRDGYNRERGELAWPDDVDRSRVDTALPSLAWQLTLLRAYRSLGGNAAVAECVPSTADAVDKVRELAANQANRVDVLVTGSLYLVGAMCETLNEDTLNL